MLLGINCNFFFSSAFAFSIFCKFSAIKFFAASSSGVIGFMTSVTFCPDASPLSFIAANKRSFFSRADIALGVVEDMKEVEEEVEEEEEEVVEEVVEEEEEEVVEGQLPFFEGDFLSNSA